MDKFVKDTCWLYMWINCFPELHPTVWDRLIHRLRGPNWIISKRNIIVILWCVSHLLHFHWCHSVIDIYQCGFISRYGVGRWSVKPVHVWPWLWLVLQSARRPAGQNDQVLWLPVASPYPRSPQRRCYVWQIWWGAYCKYFLPKSKRVNLTLFQGVKWWVAYEKSTV